METSTSSVELTGVVPSVCDAEAGAAHWDGTLFQTASTGGGSSTDSIDSAALDPTTRQPAQQSVGKHGFAAHKFRSVITELCAALRSALDDERAIAEDRLRRAAQILQEIGGAEAAVKEQVSGGLAPWQIRKVTSYVEAHLDRPIRNEELAALVRLNPSHFGRAFRNSVGEPPHEYVIRRRVERAQGLMLSSDASLSEIALDCGLADQSHLTRLFRRFVGDSPRAWRRARSSAPAEYA
jgi:AraC-like DNA-binding protein